MVEENCFYIFVKHIFTIVFIKVFIVNFENRGENSYNKKDKTKR